MLWRLNLNQRCWFFRSTSSETAYRKDSSAQFDDCYLVPMSSPQYGPLLNEDNWAQITQNLQSFPFRISEIRQIQKEIPLSQVSFKYNLYGAELYYNGQQEIRLSAGEYLLATNHKKCEVRINQTHEQDLGLCVDIDTRLLQQGLQSLFDSNNFQDLKVDFHAFFLDELLFERFRSNAHFDQWLTQLFLQLKSSPIIHPELLQMEFIRQFLFHHSEYLSSYAQLPVLKASSKKALYQKMLKCREILQDHVYGNISISEMALEVHLSQYRLYHVFKSTFGISPHRYLLQLKLNEALSLYRQGSLNWTQIAELLHFADLQSFSKLFRKYFRMSPKRYTEQWR